MYVEKILNLDFVKQRRPQTKLWSIKDKNIVKLLQL